MIRALLKKAPKIALVVGIIVGSTVLFAIWWLTRPPHSTRSIAVAPAATPSKLVGLEEKWERLLLVDRDLYDVESGELLAKDWLKEIPQRLFFDRSTKKFLGQFERGFVRYDMDGREDARLLWRYKPAFATDFSWAVYAKEKDICRADIDWQTFKIRGERKVTSVEQFYDQSFADNIFVGTEKTIIVRNANKLLYVNLQNGDVKPVQLPLQDIAKRRSPDGKVVVGLDRTEFYCWDVDSNQSKTHQIGRGAINDYQWLSNDRCVAIGSMKTILEYDRGKDTLDELVALPTPCQRIGEPSPDGRFVFCSGRNTLVLVDTVKKTATQIVGGAGISWLKNDTFAFFRETPDSDLRGTWVQTAGEKERRVSLDPYIVNKDGAAIIVLQRSNMATFLTKHGLNRMSTDGDGVSEYASLQSLPTRLLAIQEWPYR